MARKRMIDPEFWSDEEIGKWPPVAKLFYIGLWNFADDNGRFKAHRSVLYSQIFPYNSPKHPSWEKLKDILSAKVVFYEVNGCQYGFLRNFNKHQRIDKPQPSKLPPPPGIKFDESSENNPGTVPPNIKEENIREEKRREGGPALASSKSQAVPTKSLKNISNDTLEVLKKQMGSGGLKKYLLDQGYPKTEVEALRG